MMDSDGEREKESVHYFLFLHPPLSIRPAVYARIPHFSYQGDGGKKTGGREKQTIEHEINFTTKEKDRSGFFGSGWTFPSHIMMMWFGG